MNRRISACGVIALGAFCACAGAARPETPEQLDELHELTIEQLANLEVTSVSRRPESISEAPAAIEVITSEDIRRSGGQSLPEVLRLARNLEVARVDSQYYTISARGFNSFQASNKLLVLIDGRSVYHPLYSGVLWDQQQVPLQDIERIEVISGPGGTLWGANAVNGVINIITQSAADTQGFQADIFAGDIDSRADLRYGGRIGDNGSYRLYASALDRGSLFTTTGAEANDDWQLGQVGFRSDWGGLSNSFMLQGAYHDRLDERSDNTGSHLLGRWRRLLEDGSSFELQGFYSHTAAAAGSVSDELHMWDIELQHTFAVGGAHQIVWGGGYRISESEFITPGPAGLAEPQNTLHTANIFIQDEIALRDNLSLTLGLKLEDHTFTDLEYMPSARLAWHPAENSLVWAAVSRAVRTPSRIDYELEIPGVVVPGQFQSEYLIAYELGYRRQPNAWSSFSINLYYHEYEGVRTLNLTPPGVLPACYCNGLNGGIYGAEAWADFAINEDWRISAGATLLESDLETDPLAIDFNGSGYDPSYQIFLRSRADLSSDFTLDLDLRAIDSPAPQIPAYVELGARLGWRVNDNVEIALAGHNLLDESHPESFDEGPVYEARRTVQLSARLTY
ncbi:TonB-dependent receptor plug domain-containing protein [Terricaulis sp.]|uniref:TonB-dependent receptor plug domain-containing protein n=1 Tax=Terricaulis sp. TaxID=2768686 RepID=UPI002AC4F3B1|nr:TonB-dependent receptor [Terricaulis sp.]MDZ4691347.1 TonB-dependent receptor [Terricaulis sp.]